MLNNLAQNFIKYLDRNSNGTAELSEYQLYLKGQRMPGNIASNAFSLFDSNGDGQLSQSEMYDAYLANDTDASGSIEFSEFLSMQNQLSGININTSITQAQYTSLFSGSMSMFASADADYDGQVTVAEYASLLERSNYDTSGAAAFINYYDVNGDGQVNLLEFQQRSIAMDTNNDGGLSTTEMAPVASLLRPLTTLEIAAKNMVKSLDGIMKVKDTDGNIIKDGVIDADELKAYYNKYRMHPELAKNMIDIYGSGSTISYDQLVSAYKSVDTDSDGAVSFSEGLALQNTVSSVKFDVNINPTQYTGLFKIGQTFMALDTNKDGIVDVTEMRAQVDASNAAATNSQNITPEGYAENIMLLFDMDKNDPAATYDTKLYKEGSVDLFEYMKGLMAFDKNSDGTLNSAEALNLKDQLFNTKLFDDVNKIYKKSDANEDRILNLDELKSYFISEGLPAYLADAAINYVDLKGNKYDLDGDGSLSRLEWMQIYKLFDANKTNQLDIDEQMTLYDDLTKNTVNLGLNPSSVKQYTNLFSSLQEYIKELDWDNNALLSKDELKGYYKDQNLPAYLAENAVSLFDLNADGNLDLLELFKMNMLYDKNANGSIELNEELNLDEVLSGVQINATPANEVQYSQLYLNLKDYLTENDIDSDKNLDENELKAYFKKQDLPDYLASTIINTYDFNTDGKLDILEFLNANIEFDTDKSGNLELNERLSLLSKISGVNLGATPANQAQYSSLFADVQKTLKQFDLSADKAMDNTEELKAYFASKTLPSDLISGFLTNYDFNNDSKIDSIELMKAYIDFDKDLSGKLELNEELNLEGKLAGIDLGATIGNQKQYASLYEMIKDVIIQFDGTSDKQLSSFELREFFKLNSLPGYLADSLITQYDNNVNANIDLLEWLKTYIEFDVNKNGALEFNEKLAFESKLQGINLSPTPENETQYKNLYDVINVNLNKYDLTKDKTFDLNELTALFKTTGVPAYVASNFIAKYDVNTDGNIDILEYLKAQVDYDKNLDGVLQFNEQLALNSETAGVALNSTVANEKQYLGLYNNNTAPYIAGYDKSSDGMLNQTELAALYNAQGFSASLASEALNLYDVNSDGSLDQYEYLKSHIDFDANTNGVIDTNELLAQYAKFAQINGVSANISEAKQNIGNFNYASGVLGGYDKDLDKNLDISELTNYYKALGLPQYMAAKFLNDYDVNSDGRLNNLEMMKGFIDADVDKSGGLEFDNLANMYAAQSGVAIAVNNTNLNQTASLYSAAIGTVAGYDSDGDKSLSQTHLDSYFKALGLPQYMSGNFMASYDNNGDNSIDGMELLKAFVDVDVNKNGGLDFEDLMKMYSQSSGVNVAVTSANINQTTNLYNASAGAVAGYDADGDKKLSQTEVQNYFKALGLPQYMANNFIGNYDNNGDNSIDTMELMKSFINIDSNQNGGLDFSDLISMYSESSGVNISVTSQNTNQMTALYSTAASTLGGYDANTDKRLSSAELGNWFKALGMTQTMADNLISQYDNNGDNTLDTMEFMKSFIDIDINKNGGFEFDDLIKLYSQSSGVNLTVSDSNRVQYTGLYNNALGIVGGYDGNGDKNLSQAELQNYFKALGLPQYMSNNFIAQNDQNADGQLNGMELMDTLRNIDANQNGGLDFEDLMKIYSQSSGVNIPLNDSNVKQITSLYSQAAGTVAGYDGNADQRLSQTEVQNYFKALGMSQYMANNFVTQNDRNGDGNLDSIELLNNFINIDANQNGGLDFEDLMRIYSQTSGVNINITDANRAQVTALYNLSAGIMNGYDGSGNKEVSSPELFNWMKNLGMTQSMVSNFVANTDANGNGSLDTMELLRGLINSDSNGSGGFEVGDIISLLETLSGINLTAGYNPPDMLTQIYSVAAGIFGYDYNQDKTVNNGELTMYFQALGLTPAEANNAAARLGNSINLASWLQTLEGFDANRNGVLENDEVAALVTNLKS